MKQEHKIEKIKAKCQEILELGKLRTQGSWSVQTAETECGHACTPNGCCGHDSGVAEFIIGPALDLTCDGDVFEQLDAPDGFQSQPWNSDMEFIASCAGTAEAMARSTLVALDALSGIMHEFHGPSSHQHANEAIQSILSAWPDELLA